MVQATSNKRTIFVLVVVIAVMAVFGAYKYAAAKSTPVPVVSASASSEPASSSDVQRVSVSVAGTYNPGTIKLKAGVPAEITFGESRGCTAVVMSSQLGFREDLTSGPKTVKLNGLKPGTYRFSCGMQMVTGKIVVE